jgi:hypothetical protein
MLLYILPTCIIISLYIRCFYIYCRPVLLYHYIYDAFIYTADAVDITIYLYNYIIQRQNNEHEYLTSWPTRTPLNRSWWIWCKNSGLSDSQRLNVCWRIHWIRIIENSEILQSLTKAAKSCQSDPWLASILKYRTKFASSHASNLIDEARFASSHASILNDKTTFGKSDLIDEARFASSHASILNDKTTFGKSDLIDKRKFAISHYFT